MTNVLKWVNQQLNRFGFKDIKSLPVLGGIKPWKGDEVEDGVIQLFFSSHDVLSLYMHDIHSKKTDIAQNVDITVDAYLEESTVSAADVEKSIMQSRKDALSDPKYLKEVSQIDEFIKSQESKKNLENLNVSFIQGWYGNEVIIKSYNGEVAKVENIFVDQGDLILANDDFSGFAIEKKSGARAIVGNASQFFSIPEKKESNWIFFTLNMNLMNFLSETTNSRVVYVEDINKLEDFLHNKREGLKFCLLVDFEHESLETAGFDKILPPESERGWGEFLSGTQDVEIVRTHLRTQLKRQ